MEKSLKGAALWEEVADHLQHPATELSLGQQQRLCIARVLAIQPEVILMDEPCSALDPIATLRIEELMQELKRDYTIVIVTHNMQQAARAADWVGFFLLGELLEYGSRPRTSSPAPKIRRTEIISREDTDERWNAKRSELGLGLRLFPSTAGSFGCQKPRVD